MLFDITIDIGRDSSLTNFMMLAVAFDLTSSLSYLKP